MPFPRATKVIHGQESSRAIYGNRLERRAAALGVDVETLIRLDAEQKEFINEVEVSSRLGVPKKTLQNWRTLGRGPRFRKFGSGVRYKISDLDAWVESLPTGGAGVPSSAVQTVGGGR